MNQNALNNIRKASEKFSGEKLAAIAEQWGFSGYVNLSGEDADGGKMEDWGEVFTLVLTGEHRGHIVRTTTAKHDCGAYAESQGCDCGAVYRNAMNGCWQQGHQREEEGTRIL